MKATCPPREWHLPTVIAIAEWYAEQLNDNEREDPVTGAPVRVNRVFLNGEVRSRLAVAPLNMLRATLEEYVRWSNGRRPSSWSGPTCCEHAQGSSRPDDAYVCPLHGATSWRDAR